MKKICILKILENSDLENNMYANAVKKFNGSPFFIDKTNLNELNDCNGIIITGGYDKGEIDDYLIKYSLDKDLPLLGICQGMQSMAMYLSNEKLEKVDNHHKSDKYSHDVFLKESRLKDIYQKDQIKVNSHHIQTIRKSTFFEVVGLSNDNLIEAVENKNHEFQIGVQWHPERMLDYDEDSNKLFKAFLIA